MTKDKDEIRFEEVARLIRREEDRALEEFRKSGFQARLKSRLYAVPGKPVPGPVRRRALLPISALALTIVILGAAAVVVFRPAAPLMDARAYQAVLEVLEDGPAFLPALSVGPSGAAATGSDFSWADPLARLLGRIGRQEPAAGPGLSSSGKTSAPLSHRERMRLLYKDKVIERALVIITEKTKEA